MKLLHFWIGRLFLMSAFALSIPAKTDAALQEISLPKTRSGKPVEVTTGIQLLSIYSIDSRNESFDADLYLWAKWNDPRGKALFTNEPSRGTTIPKDSVWGSEPKLWNPYIELNASSLAKLDQEIISFNEDDEVEYQCRAVGQFRPTEGTMNFRMFPFDSHKLRIQVSSFVHTAKKVVFTPDPECHTDLNPSPIVTKVGMHEWKIGKVYTEQTNESFIADGPIEDSFSTLSFIIPVKRKSSYYVLRWVIPLLLILCLAWLTLFSPVDRLEVQSATVSASFLSLVALNFVVATDLPHCEYLTLFDHGLIIAYITVLITAIIIFRASQVPKEQAYSLFRRSQWSMPATFVLTNLIGAFCFSRNLPDWKTILIDVVLFIVWAAYVGQSFLGYHRSHRA